MKDRNAWGFGPYVVECWSLDDDGTFHLVFTESFINKETAMNAASLEQERLGFREIDLDKHIFYVKKRLMGRK